MSRGADVIVSVQVSSQLPANYSYVPGLNISPTATLNSVARNIRATAVQSAAVNVPVNLIPSVAVSPVAARLAVNNIGGVSDDVMLAGTLVYRTDFLAVVNSISNAIIPTQLTGPRVQVAVTGPGTAPAGIVFAPVQNSTQVDIRTQNTVSQPAYYAIDSFTVSTAANVRYSSFGGFGTTYQTQIGILNTLYPTRTTAIAVAPTSASQLSQTQLSKVGSVFARISVSGSAAPRMAIGVPVSYSKIIRNPELVAGATVQYTTKSVQAVDVINQARVLTQYYNASGVASINTVLKEQYNQATGGLPGPSTSVGTGTGTGIAAGYQYWL